MRHRRARKVWLVGVSSLLTGGAAAQAAFPPPVQANPAAEYTAEIPIDYQNVHSYTRTLRFDDIFNNFPSVYWFKYTSNGRTALKLDTLGSDFGTNGPGGPSGGGPVLGSYNQSQVAVYTASGQTVGISKNTRNLAGDPIPIYPTYSNNPDLWYHAQGLTEMYLAPGIPTRNPHWDADPSEPTGYTAWAAPGNEGNSQKYFPPHYPTTLNEYHVWHTALSPIMLDMNGDPVINPSTGQPRAQPGWRYYDRARHGPGTPWNRFEQLPPGEYFIAIAAVDPVFAGDTYPEEILRAPIHYDPMTQQTNQQKLTQPMGPFQYYLDTTSPHYGNINLNVTQTPAPATLVWVGGQSAGAWDVQTTLNWKNGTIDDMFFAGDNVVFNDTSAQTTVNLAPVALLPNAVIVNANQNYTFTGSGSISGAASLTKAGDGRLTIANTGVNNYTGGTQVVGGTLELASSSTIGSGPLAVGGAGRVDFAPGRATAVKISALTIEAPGRVDIANNALIIDYTETSPISDVQQMIRSAYNSGAWNGPGITSSSAAGNQLGIGYTESNVMFASFPATFAGQQVDNTALLIRFTRFGDATLDGVVNLADFNRLAANFGATGAFWSMGDFNHDGLVNLADFNLLAGNFGLSAAGPEVTPQDWSNLASAVPEPSLLGLTGVAASGFMLRRRRQRSMI